MHRMTAAEARGALLAGALLALVGLCGRAPRVAPPPPVPPPAAAERHETSAVDLNRAAPAELDALPGIGPVLAERIVAHRARHGRFETLDELAAVRGIGPRLIERLRGLVHAGFSADSVLP
jgi:competence protein ComEA